MSESDMFLTLGISLGLGLLVGLQRQLSDPDVGGVRTFALLTLLGTISALLAPHAGGWTIGAGMVGVVAAIIVGNVIAVRRGVSDPGITTEAAMLVMFGVGALLVYTPHRVGVAVGVATAVILHAKTRLHALSARLGAHDLRAILTFALMTFIILPVVPDRAMGPYGVLNPYHLWLMVVLVVGISLGGYLLYKFLGHRAGTLLGGALGGLISSTATTVSYSRRVRQAPGAARVAVITVMLATAAMYGRVLVEIGVVAPDHRLELAIPILGLMGVTLAVTALLWLGRGEASLSMPEQTNPTELKSALVFGALYAVVLVLVAAARDWLGQTGLYVVSAISGLTDMDAITLSTSRFVAEGRLEASVGRRAVVIAAIANMAFKTGVAAAAGGRALAWRLGGPFLICSAAGVLMILLLP